MKIDLHTHCFESTGDSVPTVDTAKRIVDQIKMRGLDGIAVTEHYTDYYGHEVKEIVDSSLNCEIAVIPGKEIAAMLPGRAMGVVHVVELYLPGESTFRFIAHPGHPYVSDLDSWIDGNIHGIELRNAQHMDELDEITVRQLAEKHDLILLSNSDAHTLGDIGTFYNDIDIELLCSRAGSKG